MPDLSGLPCCTFIYFVLGAGAGLTGFTPIPLIISRVCGGKACKAFSISSLVKGRFIISGILSLAPAFFPDALRLGEAEGEELKVIACTCCGVACVEGVAGAVATFCDPSLQAANDPITITVKIMLFVFDNFIGCTEDQ